MTPESIGDAFLGADPLAAGGHGVRAGKAARREAEALLSGGEHDGVRLVDVNDAHGVVLHGDAVRDGREHPCILIGVRARRVA